MPGQTIRTTRRDLLRSLAIGAGTAALSWARSSPLWARQDDVTRRIDADLSRHAGFGEKYAGGPGDLRTADWIAGRLRTSGYEVSEWPFDAPFFVQRTARLRMGDRSTVVAPQAIVVPTPGDGITAPMVLVEESIGPTQDLDGKIALFVTPFARHAALFANRGIGATLMEAAAAGARAIVLVTMGPSGEAVALNSPVEGPFVPVPTAILAPKDAPPFIEAARRGETATLILDGDATARPSVNVVGRFEQGERWIAISTPRSGWHASVAERGTGTAVFLELADWAPRRFPDRSVFVMNTGAHEYFFAGSHLVLDQAPPPATTDVWAHIGATLAARDAEERNGDLVLLDTADPQRSLMATATSRAAAETGFRGLSGLETAGAIRANAGELSTFTDRGYENAFAVIGVHRWFHTVADTLETTDARLVAPVLRAHQRTIELLVGD
jgi:hypothetical protein